MEEIKEMIRAVCIASVGVSVLESLTEGTRLRNQMRFLLSLAFIAVIAVPIAKGVLNFSLYDVKKYIGTENIEIDDEYYNGYVEYQAGQNIKQVLSDKLDGSGINYSNLEVEVNIPETNSIIISKVIIRTKQFDEAEKIIRKNVGEETEIVNEAE